MNKVNKVYLFTLISILLIGIVAAAEYEVVEQCTDGVKNYDETGIDIGGKCGNEGRSLWSKFIDIFTDTTAEYTQKNLTVTIKNTVLGVPTTNIGTATLGSHTSGDSINWVHKGDNVVMWYNMDFKEMISNGLGNVEFINQKTKGIVNKSYSFVYLKNESRTINHYNCDERFSGKSNNCTFLFSSTEYEQVWSDYNSKVLPEGNITIGLKVNVGADEFMDGIWTIADTKISRHAYWRTQDAVTEAHGVSLSSSSTTALSVRGMNITIGATNLTLVNITKNAASVTNGTAILVSGIGGTGGDTGGSTSITNELAAAPFSGNVATFSTAPFDNVTLLAGGKYVVAVWSNGDIRFAGATFPISGTYITWTKGIFNGLTSQNDEVNEIVSIGVAPQLVGSTIVLNSPAAGINLTNSTVIFNTTVTDVSGVSNVTLFLDGVANETNTSGVNGTYIFTKSITAGNHGWTIGVKNTANEVSNSSARNFTIDWVFKVGESYSSQIIEGGTSTFTANFTTNGTSISIANLTYNLTGYPASITTVNSSFYTATKSLTAPSVTANTNVSFYWNVTLDTGFYKNFTSNNQTILNFGIDNCSTNTAVLYNFTIVDEDTQARLNGTGDNTTGRVDIQVYNTARTNQFANFSSLYNRTNSFSVCLTSNLSQGESYVLDALIEYSANGYETEFYNIQNETINHSDFPTNITLYDLITTNSQPFKIIFKDSSFLAVAEALIRIERKYVSEGVFKVVEIPKTDGSGQTLGHFVLNNVIYNLYVIKNGQVIGSLINVVTQCQNPAIQECVIDFNSFSSGVDVPNFQQNADFNFTLTYNSTSRTVQSIFVIPSGNPNLVYLNVSREDALGTSVCTDSLTTSSGTLSCVVPSNFGNATVLAQLYSGGVLQAQGQFKLDQSPIDIYGDSGTVVLGLLIMLTFIGAGLSLAGDNPVIFVICLMIGVILLFALNLVANNGFIGSTATILWFIIAIILIVIKASRRN